MLYHGIEYATNSDESTSIEILHEEGEDKAIGTLFDIKRGPVLAKGGMRMFDLKDNLTLYTYNVSKIKSLEHLVTKDHVNIKGHLRVASFNVNYAYLRSRAYFRFNNAKEWMNNLTKYTLYRYKALEEKTFDKDFNFDFNIGKDKFLYVNHLNPELNNSSKAYKRSDLDYISKSDLIYTFSDYRVPAFFSLLGDNFMDKMHTDYSLNKEVFYKMSEERKLAALEEKLYTDAAMEYLCPVIDRTNKVPSSSNAWIAFRLVYMNLCSARIYPIWFVEFALNNYEKILKRYNSNYHIELHQVYSLSKQLLRGI